MRRDLIVGRRGDSLLGEVLERSFSIRTAFGHIRVETKKIAWVHLKDAPVLIEDEIWLKTGDRLTGDVEPRTIRFRTVAGEMLAVPRDAIHSIVIGAGFRSRARGLR